MENKQKPIFQTDISPVNGIKKYLKGYRFTEYEAIGIIYHFYYIQCLEASDPKTILRDTCLKLQEEFFRIIEFRKAFYGDTRKPSDEARRKAQYYYSLYKKIILNNSKQ